VPRGAWGSQRVRTAKSLRMVKSLSGRSCLSRRSLARRCRAMIRPLRSRGVCRLGLGEARSVRAMVACCVHAPHVPRKQRASAHVLLSRTPLQCQHHAGCPGGRHSTKPHNHPHTHHPRTPDLLRVGALKSRTRTRSNLNGSALTSSRAARQRRPPSSRSWPSLP
jgi:hypothetical protein